MAGHGTLSSVAAECLFQCGMSDVNRRVPEPCTQRCLERLLLHERGHGTPSRERGAGWPGSEHAMPIKRTADPNLPKQLHRQPDQSVARCGQNAKAASNSSCCVTHAA
eukprot:3938776-Rhodomonas_salina.9